MHDSQYSEAHAHNKRRRDSFELDDDTLLSAALSPQKSPRTYQEMDIRESHASQPPCLSPSYTSSGKPATGKRTTHRVHFDLHMSIHRCTSLGANSTAMTESSLWTFPGFDDEEPATEIVAKQIQSKTENQWSRMLQRAASSNRQRYRARLEGEGWSFVGERYSDDLQEMSDESGECVDQEFDVVVLPRESDGC